MDPKDQQTDASGVVGDAKEQTKQPEVVVSVQLPDQEEQPILLAEAPNAEVAEPANESDGFTGPVESPSTRTGGSSGSVAKPLSAKNKKLKKVMRYLAGGAFGLLAVVSVTHVVMKDDRIGKLVDSQAKGVQFVRPEKWVEKTSQDGFTYYTENGSDIDNADVAVVLGTQTAPVDYASLSDDDKSRVKGAFTSQPEALSSSFATKDCDEPGEVKNNEQQRDGYDLAYMIEATCNKLKGKDTKGTVKMVFGWKGKSLQIFAVMANEQLWQQNQDKLDKILASAKPQ